jgi:hypothetical protein
MKKTDFIVGKKVYHKNLRMHGVVHALESHDEMSVYVEFEDDDVREVSVHMLVRTDLEEWEKRYLHQRDMRDAQCISTGEPVPKDEKYGVIHLNNKLWRVFRGKEFWEKFEEYGHDSTEFDKCKCKLKEAENAVL